MENLTLMVDFVWSDELQGLEATVNASFQALKLEVSPEVDLATPVKVRQYGRTHLSMFVANMVNKAAPALFLSDDSEPVSVVLAWPEWTHEDHPQDARLLVELWQGFERNHGG